MDRLIRLIGPVILPAVSIAVLFVLLLGRDEATDETPTSGRTPAPFASSSETGSPPPTVDVAAFEGPAYDPDTSSDPTSGRPQSKLWYHDGTWWAILHRPDGPAAIHRLDWGSQTWQDTGTIVDERATSRADALMADEALYVVSGGRDESQPQGVELARYRYSAELRRFEIDDDFPIGLTPNGAASATLARDSAGRLWVALVQSGRLLVAHSTGSDHAWTPPAPVPAAPDLVDVEEAAVVAFDRQIGIIWTTADQQAFFFSERRDSAPLEAWESSRTAVEGLNVADDHVSVKAVGSGSGARLLAVVKTSLNDLHNPNSRRPQVLLLERHADGRWDQYLVGRGEDGHTRPILVVDEEAGRLFVVATAPGGIYVKESSLDHISFAEGVGRPLITSNGRPNDATSTKQNVTSASGLVVVSSDDPAGVYRHGVIDLGGPPIPSPPAAPPPVAAPEPVLVAAHAFDPLVRGTTPRGWVPSNPEEPVLGQVVELESGEVVLELASEARQSHRYCRSFPSQADGRVRVTADIRFGPTVGGGLSLVALRGRDAETGSVRVGSGGRVSYETGGQRVETNLFLAPASWYRVTLEADIAAATYDWSLSQGADERLLIAVEGVRWEAGGPSLDRACFATPHAPAALYLDAVRIEALP